MIARSVTHMSDEPKPNKVVSDGQIGTNVQVQCIVYHKLCEIHHVFQREYITKFITHFPVQFNYVKIMKYQYLYSYLYYIPMCIIGDEMPQKDQI